MEDSNIKLIDLINKYWDNNRLYQASPDILYLFEHWDTMTFSDKNDLIIKINSQVKEKIDFTRLMTIIKKEDDPGYFLFEKFKEKLDLITELKEYKKLFDPLTITTTNMHSWALLSLMLIGERLNKVIKEKKLNKMEPVITKNNLFWSLANIISINIFHKISLSENIIKNKKSMALSDISDYQSAINNLLDKKFILKLTDILLTVMEDSGLIYIKIKFKNIKEGIKNYVNQVYLNDDLYNFSIIKSINLSDQLPQIMPYSNYQYATDLLFRECSYDSKNSLLISGNDDLHLFISSDYLKAVNYMQNFDFKVNIDYLDYLLSRDLNYFKVNIRNNLDLIKLWDFKRPDTSEDISNYKNSLIFISTVKLLMLYKNDTLYFNWKADSRGRLYQLNYPLNIFNNKILTPCFLFKNAKYDIPYNKDNFDSLHWEESFKVNKLNLLSVRDASASIYQIIGGLVKDEIMLKLSNMYANESKQDIYTFILNQYYSKLKLEYKKPKKVIGICKNKKFDVYKYTWTIDLKEIQENAYSLYDELRILYESYINQLTNPVFTYDFQSLWSKAQNLSRSFIKDLIMTYGYNEGVNSSVEKFFDYFGYSDQKANKYLGKVMLCLRRLIFSILKNNFPKLEAFKTVMRKIAQYRVYLNKPIILKAKTCTSHYSYQSYMKKELNRVYYYSSLVTKINSEGVAETKRRKMGPYKVIKSIDKFCDYKNSSAFGPNFVHYLDSCILVKCILQCKELAIPILTNHDCFFTTINFDKDILRIYNDCWLETLNGDLISDLIEYNEIDLSYDLLEDPKLRSIVKKLHDNVLILRLDPFDLNKLKNMKIEFSIS